MVRRTAIGLALVAFVNCLLAGCYSTSMVPREELLQSPPEKYKITAIVLNSGEEVEFVAEGGQLDLERQIIAGLRVGQAGGAPSEYELRDVSTIEVAREDMTVVVVLAAICVFGMVLSFSLDVGYSK